MITHENACNETQSNPKCEYNNLLNIATIAFDTPRGHINRPYQCMLEKEKIGKYILIDGDLVFKETEVISKEEAL